jgi:hypothetical protein
MSTPPPDAGLPPQDQPVATPPVPAPPRRSKLPWILGGVGLGLIIIVGIVVAVIVSTVLGAVKGPQAVVGEYDRAYDEVDCDLYFSLTTEEYRESFEPTCEGFESVAQNFLDSYSEYKVTVTDTSISGDTATVQTIETFKLDGVPGTDEYTYHLIKSGNAWLINQLDLL